MNKKNPIKINLLACLLIIAILVIIILCIYIVSSSIEIDITSDKTGVGETTNIISSTSDNKEETNDNDTLPQLVGEFFNIESVAKEHINLDTVSDSKELDYDLDLDGTNDKIILKKQNENYVLEYNETVIREYWEGLGTVGIVDLDNTDKCLEIWVYDNGPSDDPVYYFYRKVESKIVEMGKFEIDRGFVCDGKGTVLAADREMPWVTPQVYNCYYTIENNVFKSNSLDFSHNKDYEYSSSDAFFTTSLENVENFKKDNTATDGSVEAIITVGEKYNITKLDENAKFKILEFVESDSEYEPVDLKIMLSDGTTGYLIHPHGRFYTYD